MEFLLPSGLGEVPTVVQAVRNDQGFNPIILEWNGISYEAALLDRRPGGFLLAVPVGTFSDEELAVGQTAGAEELLGPSKVIQIKEMSEGRLVSSMLGRARKVRMRVVGSVVARVVLL